jgi:hypothetical protein
MERIQSHPAESTGRLTRSFLHFLQISSCRLMQRLARNQRSVHSAQHWY